MNDKSKNLIIINRYLLSLFWVKVHLITEYILQFLKSNKLHLWAIWKDFSLWMSFGLLNKSEWKQDVNETKLNYFPNALNINHDISIFLSAVFDHNVDDHSPQKFPVLAALNMFWHFPVSSNPCSANQHKSLGSLFFAFLCLSYVCQILQAQFFMTYAVKFSDLFQTFCSHFPIVFPLYTCLFKWIANILLYNHISVASVPFNCVEIGQ